MKYFPLSGGGYVPQLGLAPLDLNDWIEVDDDALAQLCLRSELLDTKRAEVLQVRPGADALCLDLHEGLRIHLARTFPASYANPEDAPFRVAITDRSFPPPRSGVEALDQIGRWIQEDVCLLSPQPPVVLEAGCVCFPSRWSLNDKIGKSADAIHRPVPRYQETIARPTASFLEKIQVDKPMSRLNWTVHDSDHLHCPADERPRDDITADNVLEETFLRVERQTLRRLPRSGAVVFTIKTYLTPMREVLSNPGRRRVFVETVRGLPEESARYKGMQVILPALLLALADQARG